MGLPFAFALLSMCNADVKSTCSWYTFANTESYRGLYLMIGSPDYCLRWIRSGFSLSLSPWWAFQSQLIRALVMLHIDTTL